MNRFLRLLFAVCLLSGFSGTITARAQTITDFGTGQFAVTLSEFSTLTQSATTLQVQGTDAGLLAGAIPSVVIPIHTSQLALTGTLSGVNPNSTFILALADSAGNEIDFNGAWSDFTLSGVEMTIILNLSNPATFNGTVTTLALFPGGTGSPLDFTFARLAVVPEPSSVILLGAGLMLGALWKRSANHCIRARQNRK